MKRFWISLLKLFAGVGVISFAAILIRYCTLPPLWIAFFRTFGTGFLLSPFLLRNLKKKTLLWGFIAGTFLGFHFALWIPSLFLTTVAASVMLVTT